MNRTEFIDGIGRISLPNPENDYLFHGENSAHFVIIIGTVVDVGYKMLPVGKNHELFLRYVSLLQERGGIRDQDFCVACWLDGSTIFLGLNFLQNQFLSEEDYPEDIPVFRSRNDIQE